MQFDTFGYISTSVQSPPQSRYRTSLVIHWLRLFAPNEGSLGSACLTAHPAPHQKKKSVDCIKYIPKLHACL